MESQAEVDKPAFVTPSKPNVNERLVQLTVKKYIGRSSTFTALHTKTHAYSKDWHEHYAKNNSNLINSVNMTSESNTNTSQCSNTSPRSEIGSDFDNTLSDYMEWASYY